jgi:MinD superfamily P-loop ATPase
MTDSWEDWENEDFEVPVLNVATQEQLKRLEEQKLIEEADNELARELFITINKEEDLAYAELKQSEKNKNIPQKVQLPAKKNKPEKAVNKQKENEEKQKAASKKLKEEKAKKLKEQEIFGDAEYDDTYADYEDQFY